MKERVPKGGITAPAHQLVPSCSWWDCTTSLQQGASAELKALGSAVFLQPPSCSFMAKSSLAELPFRTGPCSQAMRDPVASTVSHLGPLYFVQTCTSAVCGGGSCQLHHVWFAARSCNQQLQPRLAAKVQALCTDGARPRRPHRDAQPGDAPATSLFSDSEREAELFGSMLEKHLDSLLIFPLGDDALQSQGLKVFFGASVLARAHACVQAACASCVRTSARARANLGCGVHVGGGRGLSKVQHPSARVFARTPMFPCACASLITEGPPISTALSTPWPRLPG